jgi:hypothetical protein
MILDLAQPLGDELRATLSEVVRDMSSEIADTDNPGFRRDLEARRDRLRSLLALLEDPQGA